MGRRIDYIFYMSRTKERLYLRGLGTALVTPFKQDKSVDYDVLERLVERHGFVAYIDLLFAFLILLLKLSSFFNRLINICLLYTSRCV